MPPTANRWQDDDSLARRVVRDGLTVLRVGKPLVAQIGKLSVLSKQEGDELHSFGTRMDAYFTLQHPNHPLCLGVFGPPGSGKSFAAEQLLNETIKAAPDRKLVFRSINLSQLAAPADLSSALAEVIRWSTGQIPAVFFDEFDSSLAGTPLGWLQWLLAPMQDGVIVDHGNIIEIKKAVFVFAGGTADTFEEFPGVHEGYFRSAKGPDFLSRLRGYLNIRGPNDWPYRRIRRAIVLRRAIEKVAPGLLTNNHVTEKAMEDDFIDQILAVGRFRHGSRSVEALVEMATTPAQKDFGKDRLPADNVLASHVDAGPLDKGIVALSAGGNKGDYDEKLDDTWPVVATRLLELGAGLVYGGEIRGTPRPGGFVKRLAVAEARLPRLLTPEPSSDDFLAQPRAGRVTWVRATTSSKAAPPPPAPRIDVRKAPGLNLEEFAELSLPSDTDLRTFVQESKPPDNWKASPDACKRLGNSLSLFRMRALVVRFADAHILFGGKVRGSSGRFPGIAEEAMLALANRKPIYLCGGFGGAAYEVGQVLGLGEPWTIVPACLNRDTHGPWAALLEKAVDSWGWRFQLPHRRNLPLTYEQLLAFLRSHAIDGPNWPDNGLSAAENRELFRCSNDEGIVRLVTNGLHRVVAVNKQSRRG
jgi:hypothetical protein